MFDDIGRKTIIVNTLTDEILKWLESNFEEGQYYVQQHTVRVRYSDPGFGGFEPMIMGGPKHPMGEDFEYRGWEVIFECEENACLFKLTFPNEGRKSNTSF